MAAPIFRHEEPANIRPLYPSGPEVGRFSFKPSPELSERLLDLRKGSAQAKLARRGLKLYSVASVTMERQPRSNALTPDDQVLYEEIQAILERSVHQQTLARYVIGRMTSRAAIIEMSAILHPHTLVAMQKLGAAYGIENLVEANTMTIYDAIPRDDIQPHDWRDRVFALQQAIVGEGWHPTMGLNRYTPSLSPAARVASMGFALKPQTLRTPQSTLDGRLETTDS